MVDRALKGTVERISPEAPVPVIDIKEETQTAGGAGNVVYNLLALGASPSLISVRGQDIPGQYIEGELKTRGINVSGLVIDQDRNTITKTRVIAGHQQVVRLDVEKKSPFPKDVLGEVLSKIKEHSKLNKGIIISDYGKGIVSVPVIKTILKMAHRSSIPVMVDPKIEHFLQYKGIDCMTPNTKEAVEGMKSLPPKSEDELLSLGWKILKKLKSKSLLITRSEKGMTLFQKDGQLFNIPTKAREVFDVTGAGDTVIATFTLACSIGAPYHEAALIANFAASVVVAKLGTATVTQEELINVINQDA